MNKSKLNRVFDKIKAEAKLDYAITDADIYGDCNTCVNSQLCEDFGVDSSGIYAKHWLTGMNAGGPWKALEDVYIGHDITEEQAKIMIKVLEENGYEVKPTEYDPKKSFCIKEI
jgi:hypothetical protein